MELRSRARDALLLIYSFAFYSCFEAEYWHKSEMAYLWRESAFYKKKLATSRNIAVSIGLRH